jgi:hypothetical protein
MDCRIKSGNAEAFNHVMPGLVPGIHVLAAAKKDVDGRVKPGHDEGRSVERQRIFSSEIGFVPFGLARRRKFNGSHTRNARFSVACGRASTQFHCCLTRVSHPLIGAHPAHVKGRQPVTPTDGAGAVPAGGSSSLLLPGGPGIDPAGITTGARGASLKRDAKVEVTPSHCIA